MPVVWSYATIGATPSLEIHRIMRFRSSLARVALLGAVLPSTILAACGGGDDEVVSVDVWVRSLCSAAQRFETASDGANGPLADAVDESPDDTVAIKAAFAEVADEQRKIRQAFRDDFEDLGKPDIKDPDALIAAFRDQFAENTERTDALIEAVADIDDDEDFFDAFFDIEFDEPEFRAKLTPLTRDDPGVQDVIDAIDANDDCAAIIFDDAESEPGPTPTSTSGRATPGPTVAANPANEAWAAGVCSSLLNWITDLETANNALQAEADRASNAEDLKQILIAFLEQGLSDTDKFAFEMYILSPPDVADGEAIHDVFVRVSEDLSFLFADFVDEAHALDATSLASVTADLEAFEAQIDGAFLEIGAAFDELDQYDPEGLEVLFATLPECVELGQ